MDTRTFQRLAARTHHTPGPWAVTSVGHCHAVHPAASENERDDICRVTPHNYHPDGLDAAYREAIDTAHLIAAAPDLLASLEAAVARVELANAEGDPILSAWLPDAQAALRRAKGED